jgi:hypothetical protein
MTCRGVVRGRQVVLEDEVTLPEGTRVQVIPEEPVSGVGPGAPSSLLAWLQEAREVRAGLPMTSDSTELLRDLREGRAQR